MTVVDETGEVGEGSLAEYVVRDRIDIDWDGAAARADLPR